MSASQWGPTGLFVLLWSSGALFSRLGLDQASPFVLLALRLAVAFAAVLLIALVRGRWWPRKGTARRVAATGALLVGGYSGCYLLALEHGLTPGVLATLLGVQPLLTLLLTERPLQRSRIAGLLLCLGGLVLVVFDSLSGGRVVASGLCFAFAALLAMTWGTLLQKQDTQPPADVMPLQYAVGFALCLLVLPSQPWRAAWGPQLAVAALWLGLVISVAATLLLYGLLARGNVVNVTSLFYLVPSGTALLDWLVLGNAMAPLALAGLGAILVGLWRVYATR